MKKKISERNRLVIITTCPERSNFLGLGNQSAEDKSIPGGEDMVVAHCDIVLYIQWLWGCKWPNGVRRTDRKPEILCLFRNGKEEQAGHKLYIFGKLIDTEEALHNLLTWHRQQCSRMEFTIFSPFQVMT